jgi:ElaB/YqjD/DUF883 family membrane-anchored ribosome-binding protein
MATTALDAGGAMRRDDNMGNLAPDAMNESSAGAGDMRDRVDDVTNRAAGAARDTVSRVAGAASQTVDRLSTTAQDAVNRASDTATQYAGRVTETGERFIEDARDYIAANPLRTIGIAAAAGFLIGRMMR